MNNYNYQSQIKSDKKVIMFYMVLAVIPFIFSLLSFLIDSLPLYQLLEGFIYDIEVKTNTIFLIPTYVLLKPIDLLLTLIMLLIIKIARAIFIKDSRFSYAAIGIIFCYRIFVTNILNATLNCLSHFFIFDGLQLFLRILTIIIEPLFVCLIFYLCHKNAKPETEKKQVFRHIYLGMTIPFMVLFGILTDYFIPFLTTNYELRYIITDEASVFLYQLPVIIIASATFIILIICSLGFKDLRSGLISVAAFSIPLTIAAPFNDVIPQLVYELTGYWRYLSIANTATLITTIVLGMALSFIYFLFKILVPHIKMRKKAKKNTIPGHIINEIVSETIPTYEDAGY